MVTDRELMQQALKALEQVLDWAKTHNRVFIHDRLITLLRERLAQPVQEPRQWVELTEADIFNADPNPHNRFDTERMEFARNLEAVMREKNHG